ncbi:hypothetical protein EDC18_106104 [Natranaerovirga pectinivora]|uniref:Uncharacterized protein n=1 Tax=Natranaerovirga pectinivora TaxID=682400 RepID=A0A4R3MJS1_9FIRM|nr:DUF6514 family protein [Natranaerovirga pectinivora]TCT14306.1 hypothetical protein EDC18_106104 [Natranaerovirga pectinivora]
MYSMYLEGSKKIALEKDKKLEIEYYITENNQYIAEQLINVYGIKIINKIYDKGNIYYEVESVKKISYSKDLIQRLLSKLINHLVTPVCMIEIIDELISEMEEAN